jgi:hypothetical protein
MSYLVLEVRPYDFSDEKTGRRVVGTRVTYLDPTSPASHPAVGFPPMTISADAAIAETFAAVPGLYELDFRQRAGQKGRPVLSLAGARLVRAVTLTGV